VPRSVPEFLDLLKALNAEGVRYVVVGGLAMVLQGTTYVTYDLDIAPSPEDENVSAIVRALASLHPRPFQYVPGAPFVWDEKSFFGPAVELITEAGDVDILRVLPGLDSFEGLLARSEIRRIGELEIRIACLEDLIAMKAEAHKPKDLDHIRQLLALKELREKGN